VELSAAAPEVLTSDVVRSSAIEGERLDAEAVRSSIARRLGLPRVGVTRSSRDVEGIVEVMLDATRNARIPITAERLCGWHAALFPVGYSGTRPIAVGTWRPVEAGVLRKAETWRLLQAGAPVTDRQRLVVNRLLDGFTGGLTTSKYAKLAKCSPDTALREIQDLVARGVLARGPGGGRSTSYHLAEPNPGPKA
jgi:Fic family protein